jgi:uncharacterized protein
MDPKVMEVVNMINSVLEDGSIPKNIRGVLSGARNRLVSNEELVVKVSAAIYLIEPVSEDVNLPSHARTQIWGIMGALESIKH